jgi:hypothetical protein
LRSKTGFAREVKIHESRQRKSGRRIRSEASTFTSMEQMRRGSKSSGKQRCLQVQVRQGIVTHSSE